MEKEIPGNDGTPYLLEILPEADQFAGHLFYDKDRERNKPWEILGNKHYVDLMKFEGASEQEVENKAKAWVSQNEKKPD